MLIRMNQTNFVFVMTAMVIKGIKITRKVKGKVKIKIKGKVIQ